MSTGNTEKQQKTKEQIMEEIRNRLAQKAKAEKEERSFCLECGRQRKDDELPCSHFPDIFLDVWDRDSTLCYTIRKNDSIQTESFDFNVPEKWVRWVLETSGGNLSLSGTYRLPGMLYEWVLAMSRKNEKEATAIGEKIDKYLERLASNAPPEEPPDSGDKKGSSGAITDQMSIEEMLAQEFGI